MNKLSNFFSHMVNYAIFLIEARRTSQPIVKNSIETLEFIKENHCSVSRFGDGEFKWIAGIKQNSFQEDSEDMSKRLKEVIISNLDRHIVCIPDRFKSLSECRKDSKIYWADFMKSYRQQWIDMLDMNKIYYDTNISRLYYAHNNIAISKKCVSLWMNIWDSKDIIIVEGEFTRLGVGNNLFSNARNIERIVCPAKNAWSFYDKILETTKQFASKESLILIALGPTATIMAYDLSKAGFWAIDIGHIDIEYEWLLMGASEKVAIKGKYTNESDNNDLNFLPVDKLYESQIVSRVGVN